MGASESKLTFKEDVFRLAREENIPPDSTWWAQFYQLPESADDVFALWSPNDVRNLTLNSATTRPAVGRSHGPKKNLETLIYTCVSRLQLLQTRRAYDDPHRSIAPEVLNCMRILTRLLPYIYEAEHLAEWEEEFFWQPRKAQQMPVAGPNRSSELFDGLNPLRKLQDEVSLGEPLGELLIDCLVRYLFFPGFTLPKKLDKDGLPELRVQYHIWTSGIGCRQSVGMTKENESNAAELLRLLLALCSRQCYLLPHDVAESNTKALIYLTTQLDRQVALSILCSLLNSVLKYNPATWRVPVDMSFGSDTKSSLVTLSLQFLDVLLLYPVPDGAANAFRKALSRLHRAEDFQFIQQGLTLPLTQPVSGMSSYLPGNQKAVPWASETLILLWELLQANKRFRSFIIETDRAHDLTILVLYYAMDAKDEPSKQGIVRMCVLILQTLSVEPAFGARLNKPFVGQESLPQVLRIANFHGSYADFWITSIHRLMTTTQGRLESIYPALLAIVNNIAPHLRDIERATSSKLLDLFVLMSSPKFLLEKEGNHAMLFSLLEAMNAILEHQLEANRRFVEVLVRGRKRFRALRDFTVEGALLEIDRQAQERKDRSLADASTSVSLSERNAPPDGHRSPTGSARSPQLGHVPESGAFAIGDDDDEDDDDDGEKNLEDDSTPVVNASGSSAEEPVPLQSRRMSEKARGKQPVGQDSFSRLTSRNTSNTSFTSLSSRNQSITQVLGTSAQQSFQPTSEWLETWLPYVPLHTIFAVIENAATQRDATLPRATAEYARGDTAGIARHHSQASAAAAASATATPIQGREVDASPHRELAFFVLCAPGKIAYKMIVKVQAFHWTSLSLGWYLSLLWGLIFASDIATNKGVSGVWTGTDVKLFSVKASRAESISLRSPKGAIDVVGNTIVQRLGSLSFNGAPKGREV